MELVHILMVDNEKDFALLMANALENEGWSVTAAFSGAEALAHMKKAPVDLLITDLRMPEMDGLTLMEKTLRVSPDTAAIVITAHGDLDLAVKAMKMGAYDFLRKPVDLIEMELAIQSAVDKRRMRLELDRTHKELNQSYKELTRQIAERKQVEEAHRVLVEHALYGLLIIQHDRVVFVNQALCDITGYAMKTWAAIDIQGLMTMVHAEDRDETAHQLSGFMTAEVKSPFYMQCRILSKQGETRWIEMVADCVVYHDQPAWHVTVIDNTRRIEAELALQLSEERLRQIVNLIPHPVYAGDRQGRVRMLNRAAAEFWGYSDADLNKNIVAGLPAAIDHPLLANDADLIACINRQAFAEIACNDARGRERIMQVSKISLNLTGIEDPVALSMAVDITELKKTQAALSRARDELERRVQERTALLAQSEDRLRSLIESSGDSILLQDLDGCYVYCSGAETYSRSSVDLLGKTPYECFPALEAECLMSDFFEVKHKGQRLTSEISIKANDEMYWFSDHRYPVKDANGQISAVATISRNITKRKFADKKMRDYQEKLRALSLQLILIEERERRNLARELHDSVGQNLAVCRLKLDNLMQQAPSADKVGQNDDDLGAIAGLITQIIQQTRSLIYQLSPKSLHEHGLTAAIEDLAEDFEQDYSIRIRLQGQLDYEHLGENKRVLLYRAVRELLFNVVKHAHASEVTVRMGCKADWIKISVRDNGVGLRVHTLGKHRRGFGLFDIRDRLECIGGRLEIDSAPGKGTLVVLTASCRD